MSMYDERIYSELSKIRGALQNLVALKGYEIEKDILFHKYDDGELTTAEFDKEINELYKNMRMSQRLHAL